VLRDGDCTAQEGHYSNIHIHIVSKPILRPHTICQAPQLFELVPNTDAEWKLVATRPYLRHALSMTHPTANPIGAERKSSGFGGKEEVEEYAYEYGCGWPYTQPTEEDGD